MGYDRINLLKNAEVKRMALSLQINRDDTRPVYQQIAAQIKNQISVGRLPPGTRLPSVRQMADSLKVNRLTVHNAYSELQADGWVESTVGRGTYVLKQAQPLMLLSVINCEASAQNVLYDIESIKQIPTMRSLAYAEPDPALFPADEFMGSMIALRREAANLLSYDSPQGDPMLRVELTTLLRERGVLAMPDEIVVTSGGMQAISLIAQALAQPGDAVLVEQPTYLGTMHVMKMYGLRPIPIPMDEEGPDLDVIEHLLQTENPRFFYTVPTFHNPTGMCMSHRRRCDLLALANRYHLPVVEDDIYGLLAYDAPAPLALKAEDEYGVVTYISSISKVLMPGLRIGWMVLSPEIRKRVLSFRLAADLFGISLIQRALANFLHQGRLKAHLRRVLPVYRERRDALLRALDHSMPAGVTWTHPAGGFSNWVTLPNANMMTIYEAALKYGIAFTPGEAFLATPPTNRHFRLCFSKHPAEDLDTIVALLGDLVYRYDYHRPIEEPVTSVWTPLV